MKSQNIPFADTGFFSGLIRDYIANKPTVQPFIEYPQDLNAFQAVIDNRHFSKQQREILTDALTAQYENMETSWAVNNNINSLADDHVFTVATAHQPCILTGPLYLIIKIISAINLAETLNKKYSGYHFVPIYWCGGEDHDFEEINHFHLFGKTLTWVSSSGGPVGEMGCHEMEAVIHEMTSMLGESDNAQKWTSLIKKAYLGHSNLNEATFYLINELFKEYGLVVLLPAQKAFKKSFSDTIKDELTTGFSKPLSESTKAKLEQAGYHAQAHPRDINLFYLQKGSRERIVKENGVYSVLNTDLTFSEEQILLELNQNPQNFSPNVILRPSYQENTLPNVAFIGGGGEIAYWMQLKEVFKHQNIPFPMLVVRNSIMWLDRTAVKKTAQLGLEYPDWFKDIDVLIKDFINQNADNNLSLAGEMYKISAIMEGVSKKAAAIDPTLKQAVMADGQRIIKTIQGLEGRIMKAEKQKSETSLNQIRNIKSKLFPVGKLQERYDNITSFYLKYGDAFIPTLKEHIAPLEAEFQLIVDEG